MLNEHLTPVRTEHDSSHFELTRSSEMNVKAIPGQLGERRPRFAISSESAHQLPDRWSVSDFVALTKPRVMMLAVFTALVGLSSAPVRPDSLSIFAAVVAIEQESHRLAAKATSKGPSNRQDHTSFTARCPAFLTENFHQMTLDFAIFRNHPIIILLKEYSMGKCAMA